MQKLSFRLWLEDRGTPGKLGLYPPLYTQYQNYPPQDVVTWSADAITYMDPKDVQFSVNKGKFKPYFWKDGVSRTLIPG
jgi:hypothetical protein